MNAADALDSTAQAHISSLHAVGRMGEAQEVANLVDGGYTAQ